MGYFDENPIPQNAEQIALRQKLETAFGGMKNALLEKKQFGKRGRNVYLPIMAVLSTALYALCAYFMSWINIEYRILGLTVGGIVYLFFMARFVLAFVTDRKTQKHAETIWYGVDASGQKIVYSEGLYVKKLETADGNLVLFPRGSYEKYSDKHKYSPLASRYDKHLQRRSCSRTVFSTDFWFQLMDSGHFTLCENGVEAMTNDGIFTLTTDDNGILKRIFVRGRADVFYDSASPVSVFDCHVPFDYTVTYDVISVNQPEFCMRVPGRFLSARRDYLLKPIQSELVCFTGAADTVKEEEEQA